jgi:AmmeMemoRadiSam system protein B
MMRERPPAVAGTWYPGSPGALAQDVDAYLADAHVHLEGTVRAIVAPHAGLLFSGPVAAWAYKAASAASYDVAVLVGPSHYVGFDGVSVWPAGVFATPLGPARIDEAVAAALLESPLAQDLPAAHSREHSLELQLPFVRRLFPDLPIVPVVIGYQTRATIDALAALIAASVRGRSALLVASTDLSHYFDAATADRLDGRVRALVDAFDPDGLLALFEQYPETERGRHVACGGGAAIAVMQAARLLGARQGRVLRYANSGDVSHDYTAVVGYLAAAFGVFTHAD